MLRTLLSVLAVTTVLAVLWVFNCSGPKAEVADIQLEPPFQPGEPYQLSALVRNSRVGKGQVAVVFRLQNKETGQSYEQVENVYLGSDDEVVVSAEIDAPDADYQPSIRLHYPPR